MLRKIRITLAVLFWVCVTALFLDFTGTVHAWLGWTARVQFLPALMAGNVIIVAALVALTLIFGRVYCSVICPMGVMQDVISWLSGRRKGKKFRFTYSCELRVLRLSVLGLFIVAIVAGIGSFVALLAPYSSYGRIVSNLFEPLYLWCNNLLALIAEHYDSYAFYSVDVWMRGISTFAVAALTFVVIGWLAWRNGRTYCNTVCPVGTVLGYLSKFALFRLTINTDKCVSCGVCSRKCKASCIDGKHHAIDYSRCVTCFDCIGACTHDAISYRFRFPLPAKAPHTESKTATGVNSGRRTFLSLTVLTAVTAAIEAQEKKVDGGLAVIEDKKAPKRKTQIVPAGALSLKHMAQHCTGCQLCVTVCPNQVLRPSTKLTTMMQPVMSFERGACEPWCVKCSEVCPAGAITPITKEEKSSTQIGIAVWEPKNCIPLTDGVECGNCARHCPAGAIIMVPNIPGDPDAIAIPAINPERCIGCGTCELLCPARPFSAIHVEGLEIHTTI
ncbi:MAG: 4Fe-4S dicluster domain-containing protein [Muribaculaceae bacterium]